MMVMIVILVLCIRYSYATDLQDHVTRYTTEIGCHFFFEMCCSKVHLSNEMQVVRFKIKIVDILEQRKLASTPSFGFCFAFTASKK